MHKIFMKPGQASCNATATTKRVKETNIYLMYFVVILYLSRHFVEICLLFPLQNPLSVSALRTLKDHEIINICIKWQNQKSKGQLFPLNDLRNVPRRTKWIIIPIKWQEYTQYNKSKDQRGLWCPHLHGRDWARQPHCTEKRLIGLIV